MSGVVNRDFGGGNLDGLHATHDGFLAPPLDPVVELRENGSPRPRLNEFGAQGTLLESEVPAVGEVHQLLELHRFDQLAGRFRERQEAVGEGGGCVGHWVQSSCWRARLSGVTPPFRARRSVAYGNAAPRSPRRGMAGLARLR